MQYTYDTNSRVQCKALRMNNRNLFASLPASACTLGTEGSFGPDRITRFTYDTLDQVLTKEHGVGTSLQQTYVKNEYGNNLLLSQTDANGNRTELEYDNLKRLKKRIYPSPITPGVVNPLDYNEYTYFLTGKVQTGNGSVMRRPSLSVTTPRIE